MNPDFKFTFNDIETVRMLNENAFENMGNLPESHVALLRKYGVSRIDHGFIQFDYPPAMKDILPKWNFDDQYEIVAHTALGDYFVWTGSGFLLADVNNGEVTDITSKPDFFYNYYLVDEKYFNNAHYRERAQEALKHFGPLQEDEALSFVPYLVMGGDPWEDALKKVNLKAHLDELAQLTLGG